MAIAMLKNQPKGAIAPHAPTVPTMPGDYWQWQGHSIYYVKAGESRRDSPPLLLIHGFGASTDHWRKNIHELQRDFEVWAIDLLGFGRSAKPDLTYSGQLWRDQLHAFIQEKIGKPVVIAGNSLGGYASLCVAADYPEAVAGVILLNSAGPFTPVADAPKPSPFQQAIAETIRTVMLQPVPSWLLFQYLRQPRTIRKTLEKVYVDRSAITDQLVADIRRPASDPGAVQVFAAVFKSPQGDTVDSLLQRLTVPLYLIWGEGDPWMKARQRSALFRQYYPQAQEVFVQAGHCPHDEVPQQVNALMREWVRGVMG
ncbi:alpha/beta fold hydrolase [Leptolyngbya sp. PCC 6406]|uniref:alpha/beta fold hydrolase n=1 Tax=Leptolyngbya sp. PCC 6406 TaxID=1173264 RepID=UPI0002AC9691|nr:alpha/beta fold hydrolase [Leptolyngbya sp. PCC 6406]